jgi:Rrf2 family protein
MSNSRFATSLHILTLMDKFPGVLLSSEFIADSININPVLVRKEIIHLRKAGFIESKEGKNGGSQLAKPSRQIRLSDVYHAVSQMPILGQQKNDPNPKCVVGKQINKHLQSLYDEVEDALLKKLHQSTLADFSKKFN